MAADPRFAFAYSALSAVKSWRMHPPVRRYKAGWPCLNYRRRRSPITPTMPRSAAAPGAGIWLK